MKKRRTEVGFFDTADKFMDALASLDKSVRALSASVDAAPNGGGINQAWRLEYRKFVRRWELERDSYASWSSRLILTVANARLQSYREAYLWWAADFERKSRVFVPNKPSATPETMSAAMVPDAVWWILGAAVAIYTIGAAPKRFK